ncbi:MAG: N-6 DNA methylase [Candidatus Jordarchaeaceae archaeon]
MSMDDRQKGILEKLGIDVNVSEIFRVFIACLNTIIQYSENDDLENLKTWNAPVLPNLGRLTAEEIRFIESELTRDCTPISELQVKVQKLIQKDERKRLAAYYTVNQGTHFMETMAYEYLENFEKKRIVIADPFLGSARTLTGTIQKIGAEKIQKVWGIELMPLPALVAYASLLQVMDGKRDKIAVIVEDAFRKISATPCQNIPELPKADIILTNPPFTRWRHLEKSYREYLIKLISGLGYEKYIVRRENSLQTLSMFLVDYMLNKNGLIVSVLPASTFYTIYGYGYKSFLRKNYDVLAIMEHESRPSFSEDSGFKEVIIVAAKKSCRSRLTLFSGLNDNARQVAELIMDKRKQSNVNSFNIHNLPLFLDINWLALFGESRLRDIVVEVFKRGLEIGTLKYWEVIMGRESIIRGVEMYGPEFFFIPSKYWRILGENKEYVEIENLETGTRLVLSREFLIRTLRKPSLYSHTIKAKVENYILSIPIRDLKELPPDLQDYIKWGIDSNTAEPAIKAYGKHWYSHVYKQMTTKKPFGQLFIPDKVDITFSKRGVFANYTEEKVAASKNFYINRHRNKTGIKILTAWFNSTLFVSILILLGRKISETWTRFLENDYLKLPVININTLDENNKLEICLNINNILNKPLPPLWKQLNEKYRHNLDLAIAEAIKIKNPEKTVEELHKAIQKQKAT